MMLGKLKSGADLPGGPGGPWPPPGGREVPQLIEGSETYQPEVKASKSDKRLRSCGQLKKTKHFCVFSEINDCLKGPPLKKSYIRPMVNLT